MEIRLHLKFKGEETLHEVLGEFAKSSKDWRFPVAQSQDYQTMHRSAAGFASAHAVKGVTRAAVAIANTNAKHPTSFRVTNIVPTERSSLSLDEYNAVGKAFVATFRRFLASRKRGERIETEGPEIGLEHIIRAPKCRRLFEAYLKTPTPTGHPSDIYVLDQFICAISRGGVSLDVDRLARHLVTDRKWSPESARWLAGRIETGLEILKVNRG
jgi:hypothetical protein